LPTFDTYHSKKTPIIKRSVMKSQLLSLLKRDDCDYIEIRLEDTIHTQIKLSGKDIENVAENCAYGGNVRALYKGGWSFVSFDTLSDIEAKVDMAVAQAREIGNRISAKSQLAKVDPIVDTYKIEPITDVRDVPLTKKMDTLLNYNEIMMTASPDIKSTNVFYKDAWIKQIFANSEGTYIEQEKMDMGCNMYAIASKGGRTEYFGTSVGSSNDWSKILGFEKAVEEKAKIAAGLLTADKPKSGNYTVILNPKLAGTFIHEAFGHLSEGDNVYENPELAQVMSMGREFGRPLLNVYDTGLDLGVRGFLKYDDEGVPTEKTYLIREGKLVGRLHSRETAGKMGERPTGSARAINYKFPPIPRMRNTCIQVGNTDPEEMIADVKNGLLCVDVFGGQTNGEMFTFKSGMAWKIENGKKTEMLAGPLLQGNVFSTLKNIDMVGTDYEDPDAAGGCGKGGQMPLPTTHGSPSVRIHDVVVSGK